jgi:hypothetical protein
MKRLPRARTAAPGRWIERATPAGRRFCDALSGTGSAAATRVRQMENSIGAGPFCVKPLSNGAG